MNSRGPATPTKLQPNARVQDDVWVEAASSKVRLQQAAAGRHGATHATHANEEHAAARKRAEERRAQGYSRHREAMLSGERMAD